MSSELRLTISHLVQVDSSTLLAAYYASPIPQPGETYRLMLGDLYRLKFERCLPLQQYAPPGRSKLRHEVLTYAEVECAQQLQLWTVAALCRWGLCQEMLGSELRTHANSCSCVFLCLCGRSLQIVPVLLVIAPRLVLPHCSPPPACRLMPVTLVAFAVLPLRCRPGPCRLTTSSHSSTQPCWRSSWWCSAPTSARWGQSCWRWCRCCAPSPGRAWSCPSPLSTCWASWRPLCRLCWACSTRRLTSPAGRVWGRTSTLLCSLSVPFCPLEAVPLRRHRALLSACANEMAASCSSRGFLLSHTSTR